jgi:hypothetical protein
VRAFVSKRCDAHIFRSLSLRFPRQVSEPSSCEIE